ncbi:hypothetical protein K469DRAFT_561046, partial [Zopfia rhizophila CBS 207.26]
DATFCTQVLRSATVAYRPLHLQELVSTAALPEEPFKDNLLVVELVEPCGSFLTIREERIYLVHQSVKDCMTSGKGSSIFASRMSEEHYDIMGRFIKTMSAVLRYAVCGLKEPVLWQARQSIRSAIALYAY